MNDQSAKVTEPTEIEWMNGFFRRFSKRFQQVSYLGALRDDQREAAGGCAGPRSVFDPLQLS